MWKPSERINGGLRALAISIACAGALTGCVSDTVKSATTGDAGTNSVTRSLTFAESPAYDLGLLADGSTTLVRLSVTTTGTGDATITSTSNSDSNFTFNGGTFPGTGGTCAQPIQGNCSVAVLFTAPMGIGSYSDTVTIAYTSGTNSGVATVTLSASVTAGAALTINGGAAYAFGTKNVGTSTDKTLTVTNAGGSTASAMAFSGLAAPINYKGGSYPGTGGTCGTALGSGSSCTVVVTYAPTGAGTTNKTLTLNYQNGIGSTSTNIAVSGTAISLASVAITTPVANPYDYGNVVIGATGADVTVTLSNTGGQAAASLSTSGLSAPINYKGGAYPGTGGTCGASLNASSTCTIVVTFTPTVTGLVSRTLGVSYDDGSGATQNLSRALQGTGVNPASLLVSDGATYDYGSHVTSSVTSKTFTVSNSGGASATSMSGAALAAPYSFKGGSYPGTAGTCGAALGVGATCLIVVDFSPVAAGTFTATPTVNYNDGVSATTATRPVTGVGTLPPALLSITTPAANPYDFGTVNIGATSPSVTVTLSNTGGQAATSLSATGLAAPFAFKGGSYPGTGGNCGASLNASSTCTMVVSFTPTAAVYSTRTLSVSYSDGAGNTPSVTRPIEGTGRAPASLAISDAPTYDFGSQILATSAYHTFTVTNSGGASATAMSGAALAAPFAYRGGSYPGTGGTCGATLAAAATCYIALAYTPSAVTTSNATLTVNYNNGVSATNATRPVTGTGINAPAVLSITSPVADPYDYGTVTIGAPGVDLTVTLSNTGGQAATSLATNGLYAPFAFKDGSYPGTGGTCGASLNASSTCTMVITFLPTTPGVDTVTLDVSYDDGTATTIHLTRVFRGTSGNAAALSISDGPTYDFGSHATSTSADYTFTVTNTGGSPATAMSGGALTAPFQYKGGTYPGTGGSCAATLGAAATCTMVLTFAPTSTGGYTDTANLSYTNGIGAASATRSLSGTGGTVANLTISDGATYDYGSVVQGYSVTKTFTVSNVGDVAATSMAGAALSAPFAYKGGSYPGTGGTCGNSLGAAGTCTVLVTYSPTGTSTSTDTLTLNYFDAVSSTSSARALSGTGATITKIAGGAAHTCALYSTGIVKCWGLGTSGQLGDGANATSSTPVLVSGLTGATDLAAGTNHTCALASGRAYCWGADGSGQIGNNVALSNVSAPAQVATYTDFTQISAGGNTSCGLRSGATVVCWGDDIQGALGDNAGFTNQATPVTVSGLSSAANVSVGRGHACATRTTGTIRCWGANDFGQLGNNSTNDSGTPVNPNVNSSSTAAVGGDTSCDLLSTGAVKCWGADDYGQLADGAPNSSQSSAATIANLANVSSIQFGLKHGCAIDATGATICFGRDTNGQLGDDASLADQSAPVNASGMSSTTAIGVGENHSCGARSTGLMYCWGLNGSGQLGDGSTTQSPTPILVQGL